MLAEDIRHPEKQPKSLKGGRKKYKRQKKRQKREGQSLKKREVSKHQETSSLPNLCRALEGTEGNITGRKNKQFKPADYEPYGRSLSGEAAQTPAHATSKRGLGREVQRLLHRLE